MRFMIFLSVFVALGSGFMAVEQLTRQGSAPGDGPTSAEAIELTGVLRDRVGLAVTGMVVSPPKGQERDFRGLHSSDGRLRPVYGQVKVLCGEETGPACWELSYLEIDGQKVPDPGHSAMPKQAVKKTDENEEIETADIPRKQIAVPLPTPAISVARAGLPVIDTSKSPPLGLGGTGSTPVVEPVGTYSAAPPLPVESLVEGVATGQVPVPPIRSSALSKQPAQGTPSAGGATTRTAAKSAAAAPGATHRVRKPWINGRAGPGTDTQVITRLLSGSRLSLIERRAGWGKFVVLNGTASDQTVWASLHILEEVR